MKLIVVLLTVLNTFSLFGGLKKGKICEAMLRAQFMGIRDYFFFSLTDYPELLMQEDTEDQSFEQKIYGPYQLVLKGIEPGTQFGLYLLEGV